jgi:phosphate transport system permease protein
VVGWLHDGEKKQAWNLGLAPADGRALALGLDSKGQRLFVGFSTGWILVFDATLSTPTQVQHFQALPGEGVTALGWAYGEQSLLVGGSQGSVASYNLLERGEIRQWLKLHAFEPLSSKILSFATSPRDKGFMALDAQGTARLYFLTAERTLKDFKFDPASQGLLMAPKADGFIACTPKGIELYFLKNPHPEVTFATLFGKIWYEGYESPEYVWQSTGGTDDFESKFSLTPLVYGTLKGAFYALLFAIPLALLSAVYTSQFMSPELRRWVKPGIELMAALPSVVLGFLAALMLAPFLEKHLFTALISLLGFPFFALITLFVWRTAPTPWQRKAGYGGELAVLAGGLLLGLLVVALAAPAIEQALFGDLKTWLMDHWGVRVDPRNSLVVGFAMGFAVIPIIYTICEDALSSVPKHLISASLAAGATSWQTAWRVVVPVAASGIFSAIMIGFGRAVGETMIVLMATGNTPVMDASPFNGFRALSANIAVEIPEAPVGGSLYRVLFLAALLLFAMTFAVNTVAEVIRLHLRKKYSQL